MGIRREELGMVFRNVNNIITVHNLIIVHKAVNIPDQTNVKEAASPSELTRNPPSENTIAKGFKE